MRFLTKGFYRFLFGFLGIVLFSLVSIFIAGLIGGDTNSTQNIAGECPDGSLNC